MDNSEGGSTDGPRPPPRGAAWIIPRAGRRTGRGRRRGAPRGYSEGGSTDGSRPPPRGAARIFQRRDLWRVAVPSSRADRGAAWIFRGTDRAGGARLLAKAPHVEAYALASLGTAAHGSPFHPQILARFDRDCPNRRSLAKLVASPKLETWFVAQHWPPAGDLREATKDHRRKFVQIPLGLHGHADAAPAGLAPADWAKVVKLPPNRTELVVSHVSLHSAERRFGFADLKAALWPTSRRNNASRGSSDGHGGFDLENVFPVVSGGAHAAKPGSLSGKLQLYRSDFLEYHASLRRAKFVYSPIGSGLDCHRHYEALLFGAIPLVEYEETLVELLAPFPVVFVREWREARAPRLRQLWVRAKELAATFNYTELRRDVWIQRVLAFRDGPVPRPASRAPLVIGDAAAATVATHQDSRLSDRTHRKKAAAFKARKQEGAGV